MKFLFRIYNTLRHTIGGERQNGIAAPSVAAAADYDSGTDMAEDSVQSPRGEESLAVTEEEEDVGMTNIMMAGVSSHDTDSGVQKVAPTISGVQKMAVAFTEEEEDGMNYVVMAGLSSHDTDSGVQKVAPAIGGVQNVAPAISFRESDTVSDFADKELNVVRETAPVPSSSAAPYDYGNNSDVEEVDAPRIPTPELIHLLDSEPEEDYEEGEQEYDYEHVPDAEDDEIEGFGDVFQAPRLLPKDQVEEDASPLPDQRPQASGLDPNRPVKKRGRKRKVPPTEPPMVAAVKTEKIDATLSASMPLFQPSFHLSEKRRPGRPSKRQMLSPSPLPPPLHPDFLAPNEIVFRGKIIDARAKPKKKIVPRGPLGYTHIVHTITGVKKAETLAVVKEEKALHPCDQCDRVYVKFRSLEVHKRRTHNSRLQTACPECGKLLSGPPALKKHILSHR